MVDDFRRGEASSDGNPLFEGRSPGIAYGDGPQKQLGGQVGRIAKWVSDRWGRIFKGVPKELCGPLNGPVCAEITSAFLEQTFRNFNLNVSPRTNLAPPWTGNVIDPMQSGGMTAVNLQAFVTVNSYTVQQGKFAIVKKLGQDANTPSAFGDTTWRIVTSTGVPATAAGAPVAPWDALTGKQFFDRNSEDLGKEIILIGPVTIAWQVFVTTVGSAYNVAGRIWGWEFSPIANYGNTIKSAIAE